MEFEIMTDLSVIPQQIDFNFEQLKKEVSAKMDFYSSFVVSADDISGARSTRADLNKLKTAIENKRKDVKKRINEPYTAFEKQVKEITSIIQSAIDNIDVQISDFENKISFMKYKNLKAAYDDFVKDIKDFIIPFEKVLPPKWENKTLSENKLIEEMKKKITDCRNDLRIISVSCVPYVTECQSVYIDTMNISEALAKKNQLERLKKEIAVNSTRTPPEALEAGGAANYPNVESTPQNADMGHSKASEKQETYSAKFKVSGTFQMLTDLNKFLKDGGYKYEQLTD